MTILYVAAAVVILGLIVAVHEFGHYLVGRLTGMGILEYAIGFGPKIFGVEKGGIKYSLRLIPLGGYCAFLGEDEVSEDPRAMRNQAVWKRFLTVAAGPVMNFVLAFVATVALIWGYGAYQSAPIVHSLVENSAAQEAGLMPGDIITALDGTELSMDAQGQAQLIAMIQNSDGATGFTVDVDRNGERLQFVIVPQFSEEAGVYQVGVMLGTAPVRFGFFESVSMSGRTMVTMTGAMLDGLKQLFTSKDAIDQTMGPVGIISTVSQQVSEGFDMALNWIVIISLNLGIMNLLPVPGLDGGRLLFLIVEGIRRKPIPTEKEAWVHAGGILLLLGLIIVITFKDIFRIFAG